MISVCSVGGVSAPYGSFWLNLELFLLSRDRGLISTKPHGMLFLSKQQAILESEPIR
jgi:hypothetical protein